MTCKKLEYMKKEQKKQKNFMNYLGSMDKSEKEEQLHAMDELTDLFNEEVIKALAVVHTELVLIHPFRAEGNGRVARMLATLMALQAGLPPLDFSDRIG